MSSIKHVKYRFHGDDTPRNKHLKHVISRMIRASTNGLGRFASLETDPEKDVLEFDLDGRVAMPATVSFNFTGTEKYSINRQPALLDIAIAGEKFPDWINVKLAELDSSPDYGWAVLVQDWAKSPVDEGHTVTESMLAESPEVLRNVSHLLIHSSDGDNLALMKLAALQGCVLFMDGVDAKWADSTFAVATNGVDDFLNKAESMGNGKSKTCFMAQVAPKVYTKDNVTALSARQLISSSLRLARMDDFGFSNTEVVTGRMIRHNTRASTTERGEGNEGKGAPG